jgi:tetratricopeptide (TPR) repeat protein
MTSKSDLGKYLARPALHDPRTICIALLAVLLIVPFAAGAQSLSVSYLDGQAQIRSGSSWSDLAVGDTVPVTASVRLTSKAIIQLKGAGLNFTLTRPGTYALQTVAAARKSLSSGTSAVVRALRYLIFGPAKTESSTAGSRAANKGETGDEGWVESGAEVFLAAGKEDIKFGQYDKAVEQFTLALEAEPENPEIRFYLGNALSMRGQVGQAWKAIEDLKPSRSDPWASDFTLLKAKLLEDASAYEEAVALLRQDELLLALDTGRAQLYFFLLGLGYRGAGNSENAYQALSKAAGIAKESDIGRSAAGLLQGLRQAESKE